MQKVNNLAFLFLGLFAWFKIFACTCPIISYNHKLIMDYETIKMSKIISVDNEKELILIKFLTLEIFKGNEENIKFETISFENNSCFPKFDIGDTVVFFLNDSILEDCTPSFKYKKEINLMRLEFLRNFKCIEDDFIYSDLDLSCEFDYDEYFNKVCKKDTCNKLNPEILKIIKVKVNVYKTGKVELIEIKSELNDLTIDTIKAKFKDLYLKPGLVYGFPVNCCLTLPYIIYKD